MKSKELGAKKGVVLNKTYVENAAVGEHRDERTLGFCLRVTDRGKRRSTSTRGSAARTPIKPRRSETTPTPYLNHLSYFALYVY